MPPHARIEGLGTDVIEIVGVEQLHGEAHSRIIADRIETGTLLISAAITGGGAVTVEGAVPAHLAAVLEGSRRPRADRMPRRAHCRRTDVRSPCISRRRRFRASPPICNRSSWRCCRWPEGRASFAMPSFRNDSCRLRS